MTFRQRLRKVRHWLLLCLLAVCIASLYSLSIKNPVGNSYAMYRLGKVARIIHDVPYCSGDAEQTIDIYLPPESTDPARTHTSYPLAIYVHGGGWSKGDKRNAIADFYGAALVRAGFAFASINYRLAPRHRYPTQNNDTACAINTLAAIAPQHAINTRSAILIGDSAGGFLVSTYALSTAKPPVTIRGVVSLYGTTDLVRQLKLGRRRNPNAFNYLGSADFATAKKASPLYHKITGTPPPFLFLHGAKDKVVSPDQSHLLYERIVVQQPLSRFIRISHAGHEFTGASNLTRAQIRETVVKFAAEHAGVRLEDGVFDDIDDIDTQALLSTPPPAIDISADIDTSKYSSHTPASTVPIFNFATPLLGSQP